MKIALPVNEGGFCAHFGRSTGFALFEEVSPGGDQIVREDLPLPTGGHGAYPAWLKGHGATVVLAGGMGEGARNLFAAQELPVVVGVAGSDPAAIVAAYLRGDLAGGENPCEDHAGHHCES